MTGAAADRIAVLSTDERWLVDAGEVAPRPGGFVQRTVDMTAAGAWLDALARGGLRATVAHLVARAAALALARNPSLHSTVCGYRTSTPGAVDIGLTAPDWPGHGPLVLTAADRRPLPALVGAAHAAAVAARAAGERATAWFERLRWLVPFGFLRRFVLRWLQERFWFRRRLGGTFQVAYAPGADVFIPLRFYTGSAVGAGRVRDVAIAANGRVEVRRVMSLSLVIDHVALDGVRAATLLNEIAAVLESGELGREAEGLTARTRRSDP